MYANGGSPSQPLDGQLPRPEPADHQIRPVLVEQRFHPGRGLLSGGGHHPLVPEEAGQAAFAWCGDRREDCKNHLVAVPSQEQRRQRQAEDRDFHAVG